VVVLDSVLITHTNAWFLDREIHQLVSLDLTKIELQQFVYACILKASILALAGLRVKQSTLTFYFIRNTVTEQ